MMLCLPTKCRYIQTTPFGRHKGSGKSKMVISDRQVVLLDIRGVTLWGGFQLNGIFPVRLLPFRLLPFRLL